MTSKKKLLKGFKPRVRTRHPTHFILRERLPRMPFRSIVRMGSETEDNEIMIECNSVKAVKNSSSKLLMKRCFTEAGVITSPWFTAHVNGKELITSQGATIKYVDLCYPLIAKHIYGSRGTGNTKIDNIEDLNNFLPNKNLKKYIFEEYKTYSREYRLHVTQDGCFYTCRKMLKRDTPENKKFQRHDDNCVWILEENEQFDKPVNWDLIVKDCVKALGSLGLDIAAFDLKVQSAKDKDGIKRPSPEWIVIESCSAPSFGEKTAQKYIEEIPKILTNKFQNKK